MNYSEHKCPTSPLPNLKQNLLNFLGSSVTIFLKRALSKFSISLSKKNILRVSLRNRNFAGSLYHQLKIWLVSTCWSIFQKIAELKGGFLRLICRGLMAVANGASAPELAPKVDFRGVMILALSYNVVVFFFTKLHRALFSGKEELSDVGMGQSLGIVNPTHAVDATSARNFVSPKTNGYYKNRQPTSGFEQPHRYFLTSRFHHNNVSDFSQKRYNNNVRRRFLPSTQAAYAIGNHRNHEFCESSGIRRCFFRHQNHFSTTVQTVANTRRQRPVAHRNFDEVIRKVRSFVLFLFSFICVLFFGYIMTQSLFTLIEFQWKRVWETILSKSNNIFQKKIIPV